MMASNFSKTLNPWRGAFFSHNSKSIMRIDLMFDCCGGRYNRIVTMQSQTRLLNLDDEEKSFANSPDHGAAAFTLEAIIPDQNNSNCIWNEK